MDVNGDNNVIGNTIIIKIDETKELKKMLSKMEIEMKMIHREMYLLRQLCVKLLDVNNN